MRNTSIFSFVREKDQYLDLFSPRLKTNLVFNCLSLLFMQDLLDTVIPLVAKYNQNHSHEKSSDEKCFPWKSNACDFVLSINRQQKKKQ